MSILHSPFFIFLSLALAATPGLSCAVPTASTTADKSATAASVEPRFPHPAAAKIHDTLWNRFFNRESRLFYDLEFTDPSQFPSDEEIAARRPSTAGWFCGMDDCALQGGWILDGILVAHRVTGDPYWAERARTTFQGLVALGTVSKVPGFVARGFAPGRTGIYPNSSADQYTGYVYGVWRYARSPVATDEERKTAAKLLVEVARLIESHGGNIPTEDGKPSIYGNTADVVKDRASRLLQFYKAAADLSGDPRWETLYREKAEERGRERLRQHFGPEPLPAKYGNVHVVFQNQAAFRLLYEAETDPELKAAYRAALDAQAAALVDWIDRWRELAAGPMRQVVPDRWRDFWEPYVRENPRYPKVLTGEISVDTPEAMRAEIVPWHKFMNKNWEKVPHRPGALAGARTVLPPNRGPGEAFAIAMLCENTDLKRRAFEKARPMLDAIDYAIIGKTEEVACVEAAIWRAAEIGLLKQP